ncbi:hypothetical protein BKA80DRAFT_48457 [Phyllosticta citrichinensis]
MHAHRRQHSAAQRSVDSDGRYVKGAGLPGVGVSISSNLLSDDLRLDDVEEANSNKVSWLWCVSPSRMEPIIEWGKEQYNHPVHGPPGRWGMDALTSSLLLVQPRPSSISSRLLSSSLTVYLHSLPSLSLRLVRLHPQFPAELFELTAPTLVCA